MSKYKGSGYSSGNGDTFIIGFGAFMLLYFLIIILA